jgi:uncharacterized membrane protein
MNLLPGFQQRFGFKEVTGALRANTGPFPPQVGLILVAFRAVIFVRAI